MDEIFFIGVLAGGIRLAMPIMFAALGETVAQRSGILNVGIEGIMLVGAFLAAWGAVVTGTPWGGLAAAIIGGALMAAVHAWVSITLRLDQIVSGIAMIVLGIGLSSYGFRVTLGTGEPVAVPSFTRLDLGPLSELPWIGPALLGHQFLVYAGFLMAALLFVFLYRTSWGLEIRAIGESPAAADAVGLRVAAVRYGCTLFGGAMAGIGGAFLAIAHLNTFVENMVAGRGFIVYGRWNPLGVMVAALFFGIADAAQIRLQALNPDIPYQFFVMAPYVLAVVFLIVFAGRVQMPSALGVPFTGARRQQKRRSG